MDANKLMPLFITALIAVIVSLFACFLISYNSNPASDKTTYKNHESNSGTDSDSDVINNVENNVNGDQADIENSIDNKLNSSDNNQIENNVSNNIEVTVDVNVTNSINNNVDGKPESNAEDGNGETNNGNNGNGNEDSDDSSSNNEDKIVWGVDSASLTTNDLLSCVRNNFGTPEVWGRYLGDRDGVSAGLTAEEAELIHSNDIKILVIWNHFTDATGFENGQTEAEEAIQLANDLGIPDGVAIFADIEPSFPVDSEFIRGWYEGINASGFIPGIYGIFDEERALYSAFERAAENNSDIQENTYIWTAAPNVGITTESNAPEYQPNAPENALIGGWQYGIDAQACNIDTNLFDGNLADVLW